MLSFLGDSWCDPPARVSLNPGELQVWRGALDVSEPARCALWRLLSPMERARADRFVLPLHRNRFTVARGLLRTILARYTGAPAQELEFEYGEFEKPLLAGAFRTRDTRFNLSHSHELALFAIARGREVGIDLERIRPDVKHRSIAERYFCSAEAEALRRLPRSSQCAAFFAVWTRKEAYVKARGEGLSYPFDRFRVSVPPERPPALLSNELDPRDVSRWGLTDLCVAPGYRATIALEQAAATVELDPVV